MVTQEVHARLRSEWEKVLVGQEQALDLLYIALLVGGHVLIEGVPGTAKTLMAKTLARLIRGEFKRVQFTPDLMPSDITGTTVFDLQSSEFRLKPGPVFTNVLLADEVNRAPAKTQSALLEAMEERQVTIDGEPRRLPRLFITLATENPIEYEGTYPLPEAQLDRFLFRLTIPYMAQEQETELLMRYHRGFDARNLNAAGLEPVVEEARLRECVREVGQVTVEPVLARYITSITHATRRAPDLALGASPRASVALLLAARAVAAVDGRPYVQPDDVKYIAPFVLAHRVILRPEAQFDGLSSEDAVKAVLASVEVPR